MSPSNPTIRSLPRRRVPSGPAAVRGTRLAILFLVSLSAAAQLIASDPVSLVRVPDGGIQPQMATDDAGTVHLLYFKGEASAGDLYYTRRSREDLHFRAPIRVNRRPASAIAMGTIRGGQLAVGERGRVHVAWNGLPPEGGDHRQAPMLYTRLEASGTAFEPERDVITKARGLDGGGSVAADTRGNVYVVWHAPPPGSGSEANETDRTVWVAHSRDGGTTFAPERQALNDATGACGCCGLKAFADRRGNLHIAYRGASETGNRDQLLLVSMKHGIDSRIEFRHPWKVTACPMSSASFFQSSDSVLAAWETEGGVYWLSLGSDFSPATKPLSPPGAEPGRKHPVIASNTRGEVLLAWTEGTGWAKGGEIAWQAFDRAGKPAAIRGRAGELPVWSFAATFVTADDHFVIVY